MRIELQIFEYANWVGLLCWLASGCCLAFFQLWKTFKHGIIKSLSAEVSTPEKKVLITAGGLFLAGIFFFILGAL